MLHYEVFILHSDTNKMATSRIKIARQDILEYFENQTTPILKYKEIASILSAQRSFWRLAQRTNTEEFIGFLLKNGKLKKIDFPFPHRKESRYTWGDVPLIDILLTLNQNCYFSHYTAIQMHGLTEQIPKTLYLNHEQGEKDIGLTNNQARNNEPKLTLEQCFIDKAFQKKTRVTSNIIKFGNIKICMLNGKFTNQLGVVSKDAVFDGVESKVRITNIERTLIDIAVRPIYAGGIYEVYKAYLNARESTSVNNLSAILKKINYVYPYHQTIGFYLEKANYLKRDIDIIRKIPINRDFYLVNEIKDSVYIKKWRLYVPKGF